MNPVRSSGRRVNESIMQVGITSSKSSRVRNESYFRALLLTG